MGRLDRGAMRESGGKSPDSGNGRQRAPPTEGCDDALVVTGFRSKDIGWKLRRAQLAALEAVRDACGMM